MEQQKREEPISQRVGSPFFICQQNALRYLSIREHNKAELKNKLLKKGYDNNIIEEVLTSLIEDGSLNEKRYVETFVKSSNKRHPEGKNILMARLIAKGADKTVCKEVLDLIYDDEYVFSLLENAYNNLSKKSKTKTKKSIISNSSNIFNALMKLGFSSNQVRKFLNEKENI